MNGALDHSENYFFKGLSFYSREVRYFDNGNVSHEMYKKLDFLNDIFELCDCGEKPAITAYFPDGSLRKTERWNNGLRVDNECQGFEGKTSIPEFDPALAILDLSDEKLLKIAEGFYRQAWESASGEERMARVEEFAGYLCKKWDIEKPSFVTFIEDDRQSIYAPCGSYIYEKNQIRLNSEELTSGESTFSTVAHECRHASQHAGAKNPKCVLDYSTADSIFNYQHPESSGIIAYEEQACEDDARRCENDFRLYLISHEQYPSSAAKTMLKSTAVMRRYVSDYGLNKQKQHETEE